MVTLLQPAAIWQQLVRLPAAMLVFTRPRSCRRRATGVGITRMALADCSSALCDSAQQAVRSTALYCLQGSFCFLLSGLFGE